MNAIRLSLVLALAVSALGAPVETPAEAPAGADSQTGCVVGGTTFAEGSRVPSAADPCAIRVCVEGEVLTTQLQCFTRDDCQGRTEPGECCPSYNHCTSLGKFPQGEAEPYPADAPLPAGQIVEAQPQTEDVSVPANPEDGNVEEVSNEVGEVSEAAAENAASAALKAEEASEAAAEAAEAAEIAAAGAPESIDAAAAAEEAEEAAENAAEAAESASEAALEAAGAEAEQEALEAEEAALEAAEAAEAEAEHAALAAEEAAETAGEATEAAEEADNEDLNAEEVAESSTQEELKAQEAPAAIEEASESEEAAVEEQKAAETVEPAADVADEDITSNLVENVPEVEASGAQDALEALEESSGDSIVQLDDFNLAADDTFENFEDTADVLAEASGSSPLEVVADVPEQLILEGSGAELLADPEDDVSPATEGSGFELDLSDKLQLLEASGTAVADSDADLVLGEGSGASASAPLTYAVEASGIFADESAALEEGSGAAASAPLIVAEEASGIATVRSADFALGEGSGDAPNAALTVEADALNDDGFLDVHHVDVEKSTVSEAQLDAASGSGEAENF